MRKSRIYTTIIAIWGWLIFAFLLVQLQYNPSFLLGDVLRLNLPENFVGVYYGVQEDTLIAWVEWLSAGEEVSLSVSYNPDRVSLDMSTFVSSHDILDVQDDGSFISVIVRVVDPAVDLFSVWFISDEEYHIVVSDAWVLRNDAIESLAIQRL
jgi:hypothetical protein